jgi:hypothetical protein
LEWTIRSRSRWNGVRRRQGGSSRRRDADRLEPLAHLLGECHGGRQRTHHHREVLDLALRVEAQQVEALDLAVTHARLEDERLDPVGVELVGVAEILERAHHDSEQRTDRRAALERLERDRAVEDDVVGERRDHRVVVACLDSGPECIVAHRLLLFMTSR